MPGPIKPPRPRIQSTDERMIARAIAKDYGSKAQDTRIQKAQKKPRKSALHRLMGGK